MGATGIVRCKSFTRLISDAPGDVRVSTDNAHIASVYGPAEVEKSGFGTETA